MSTRVHMHVYTCSAHPFPRGSHVVRCAEEGSKVLGPNPQDQLVIAT